MVDAEPSGGGDRNHTSEGHVVVWYHVIRQLITEICGTGKSEQIF